MPEAESSVNCNASGTHNSEDMKQQYGDSQTISKTREHNL